MCVKLVQDQIETSYDADVPLEDQIGECTKIVVNYDPSDDKIDKLLLELHRFSKTGVTVKLDVEVNHNNYILGAQVKQMLQKATNDISINEVVKTMVLSHIELDQKLAELYENITSIVNVKA